MFARISGKKSELDEAIDRVLDHMSDESPDSEEYAKMSDQLTKLYSLKPQPQRVSLDTLAIVAGNLIGIILITRYEREHVIGSKALTFLKTLVNVKT